MDDLALNMSDYETFILVLIRDKQWPSSSGIIYDITAMNETYLRNCIALIKREKYRLEYLPILETELRRRGTLEYCLATMVKLADAKSYVVREELYQLSYRIKSMIKGDDDEPN